MTDIKTIGDVLRASARAVPDKIAIIEGETRLSYEALDRAADRFANALLASGLGSGGTIAIMSPTAVRSGSSSGPSQMAANKIRPSQIPIRLRSVGAVVSMQSK